MIGTEWPAIVLDEVAGATVSRCRALPGTGLFLAVRGAGSRGVHLTGNDFSQASRAWVVEAGASPGAVEAIANLAAAGR